ncbi:MAG: hypothetical protein AB7O97_19785 [Planctomycetota bacterium]
MSAISRTLVVALAGALSCAGTSPAQLPVPRTSGSGPGERHPVAALDADVVAFVRPGASGARELWTVGAAGAALQRTFGADVRVGWSRLDHWPSLSISDDGARIAWWNAQGVHLLDLVAGTDTVLAAADLLPYPQLDGAGGTVVFQAPVAGAMEVFSVDVASGAVTQRTASSGPGRRLPHVRQGRVLFQKRVGEQMELFTVELQTGAVNGPWTSGSGGGNRYGRLVPDGTHAVCEVVRGGQKELLQVDLATGAAVQLTGLGAAGDRLAAPTDVGEVLFEVGGGGGLFATDPVVTSVVASAQRNLRRVSADRSGRRLWFQQQSGAAMEVFTLALCGELAVVPFGTAGVPSVGTVLEFASERRCITTLGVDTALAAGTLGVVGIGPQTAPVPLAGAPGNALLLSPQASYLVFGDAAGRFELSLPVPPGLQGVAVAAQFGLFDLPANALGVVVSRGFALTLP